MEIVKAENAKRVLKVGDPVMVIAGGNKHKRPNKGQVGKLLRFVGADKERVVVQGVNVMATHKRQTSEGGPSGRIMKEGSIHVSNVMFYSEKLGRPVKLSRKKLLDGKVVRGYSDKATKEFVQIES